MAGGVTNEEFKHVETRLGVVEREVEGEKMVTRRILEQTRRNGDDLAAVKSRLDRLEPKVDDLAQTVGGLDRKVDGLIKSLPKIVGDAVREANRERRKK